MTGTKKSANFGGKWYSPPFSTIIVSLPLLTLPTHSDNILLHKDISANGVGAVLAAFKEEEELPTAFYSNKLFPAEKRYFATELEGLAFVYAIEDFSY